MQPLLPWFALSLAGGLTTAWVERTMIGAQGAAFALDPVQRAFLKHQAFQCGYCTPGMIMAVKGLLTNHPHPTEEQARDYLSGNLCRCGTYVGVRQAVLEAAKMKGGAHAKL